MVAINNLYARCVYDNSKSNMPIVVLLHGFLDDALDITDATLERISAYGFFVVSVGMRGRNSADGSQDGSAREIYDIYDAVEYVRTNYAAYVSADKAALVGYSGGGGNALAAACKFPDYWNVIVDHFGISDYGYDGTDGWWYTTPARQATLTTWIGDRDASADPYYARHAPSAIANYSGGYLYLYHDDQDTSVPVVNTDNIKTALDGAGLSNYSYNVSTIGSDARWLHGYPDDITDLQIAEPTWAAKINSQSVWTIPASGTVTVIGYIVTERFEIWLGTTTKGGAGGGLDEVATVVYGATPNRYTVTPLTGACDVYIEQADGKTGTASAIEAETNIDVS